MSRIQATGSSSITGSVSVQGKASFVTLTQTIGTAETTITIPAAAIQFRIKAANKAVLTYSHTSTGTGSTATSDQIPKYNTWEESNLDLSGDLDIYIKSSLASTDVQITYWT